MRRQLGAYALADKIGEGAMGEVYRAWHPTLRRWCAVKVLRRDASERERARFEKEVQVTAQLCHPNTVSVYDYGRAPDGTCFYAMELLDGMTLQHLVEQHGAQPPGRVIQILLQLCAALREAHGVGLIHRDIKPDNVVLCKKASMPDAVKLFDFGLVKELASDPSLSQSINRVVGTPLYMSPEAIRAPEAVSARSDLYGLGAVAYFLLTGSPVFGGRNVVEVCSHHLHSAPERPSLVAGRSIGEDLETLVFECLAKDPEDRPASAAELGRRLARCAGATTWTRADAERWWQDPTSFSHPSCDNVIECRFRALDTFLEGQRACA
jgi:serine/threonine-protein kinase